MVKCPQCGAENFPGMAYCEQCGTALPTPEVAVAPTPETAQAPTGDTSAADAISGAQALIDQLGDDTSNAGPTAQEATHPVAAADGVASGPAAVAAPADNAAIDASPAAASAAGSAPIDVPASAAPAPAPPDGAASGFPQTAVPLPAATLTITFSDGATFTVKQDVVNVGRADIAQNWHPELDVIPFGGGDPNFGVSRHQAVIRRDGSAFSILDVGSTNGTYVNGRMLDYNKAVELHDGDAIAFGAFNGKIGIGA